MESSVEQRLSLLLDGETSEFETRRLVEDISSKPHMRKRWLEMNKQKSALHRNLLLPILTFPLKFKTNSPEHKTSSNIIINFLLFLNGRKYLI